MIEIDKRDAFCWIITKTASVTRNLYGIEICWPARRTSIRQEFSKLDLASCGLSSAAVLSAGQYLATLIAQYNDPLLRTYAACWNLTCSAVITPMLFWVPVKVVCKFCLRLSEVPIILEYDPSAVQLFELLYLKTPCCALTQHARIWPVQLL